ASEKRVISDNGYAVRDFNTRQQVCPEKRFLPDGGKLASLLKGHAAQAFAIVEGKFSDRGYAVWNRYARQGIILRERPLTDSSDRLALYFGRDCDFPFASCVPGYRHAFAVDFIC